MEPSPLGIEIADLMCGGFLKLLLKFLFRYRLSK